MRLLFRLERIETCPMVVYRDRWFGRKEGNYEAGTACVLKFKQISTPAVPKHGGVEGWPTGKMRLVMQAGDAAQYELGKTYCFEIKAEAV